jgi:hypothetical protein
MIDTVFDSLPTGILDFEILKYRNSEYFGEDCVLPVAQVT